MRSQTRRGDPGAEPLYSCVRNARRFEAKLHLQGHEQDFATNGISAAEIPAAVMAAVTRGSIIGYQGEGIGSPIYEVIFNGQVRRIAVMVGSNGFIVGATRAVDLDVSDEANSNSQTHGRLRLMAALGETRGCVP